MQPSDIQQIGGELAIKWADGGERFHSFGKIAPRLPLRRLQRGCETDILGNVYKNPEEKLTAAAFQPGPGLEAWAVTPFSLVWADGHATGIFSFDYLKRVAMEAHVSNEKAARSFERAVMPFSKTYPYCVAFWSRSF